MTMYLIQLDHPTDPRYLMVSEFPERVTMEDLRDRRYGKLLTMAVAEVALVYPQPRGLATDWVRPDLVAAA
jgi:hypothetical protein